jgi:hypothetical protein
VKLIEDMRAQWSELDRRIEDFDEEFATFAKVDEDARLLVSIPRDNRLGLDRGDGKGGEFCQGT